MVQRIGKVMSKRIDLRLYGVLQRDVYQLQNYAIEAISSESLAARMLYESPYVSSDIHSNKTFLIFLL